MDNPLKALVFISSFFLHNCLSADNITVSGEVSGNWNYDTVFVTGNLAIADGNTVIISPGSVIVFTGSFDFQVAGSIHAAGTPTECIKFLCSDTSGFHIDTIPGGGWGGIRFDSNRLSNDSSIFDHCSFEFAKVVSEEIPAGSGGAISINNFDKVRISHCRFENNFARYNGGAIWLDSANIIISYSVFNGNRAGLSVAPWGYGGAVCSDNSSPEVFWNIFENNSSTGVGGALAVRFTDCNVYNNIFTGNFSALGGAFGFLHIPECTHRINTNLIAENASEFFGGGVANLNASPIYINNTIVFNESIYGGGFYCKDSVSPDFYNTIIWGNTAAVGTQGYLFEVYSQADFFFCDVQDGPMQFGGSGGGEAFFGAFESCLDEDPDFLDSGDHPYSLEDSSPCINSGSTDTTGFYLPETDLLQNPRVFYDIIDIGAYEVMWSGTGKESTGETLVISPNPTSGKFRVQSSEFKVELRSVEVYSLNGQVLEKWNLVPGIRDLEFDLSHLPDGVYFIRMRYDEKEKAAPVYKVSQ